MVTILLKKKIYKGTAATTIDIHTFNRADGKLKTANLGDSSFKVIRDGKITFKSVDNIHDYNMPHQLDHSGNANTPNDAVLRKYQLKHNDLIIVASDGLWDNLTEKDITAIVTPMVEKINTFSDKKVQNIALKLLKKAEQVIKTKKDAHEKYKNKKIDAETFRNFPGKPDDVTILVALVSMNTEEA